MKHILLLPLILAVPAFAGPTPSQPMAPEPNLYTWFAGASVGYLTEFEEPMYNLHVGKDTSWSPGGWNVSFFAEIGYAETDDDWSGSGGDDDLDVIPLTLNMKFERPLTGNLNAYLGGGLGAARLDLDADLGFLGDFSDDDWVFTGQLFTGLNYNVNPNFEVYGGARWIYYDDASFSDNGISGDLDVGDDFLLELGIRFNF